MDCHEMHTRIHISYTRSMTFAKIVLACAQWRVWGSLMEAGDKPRRLSIRTVVAIDGEMGIGYRGGMPWPFMKWVWSYNLRHLSRRLYKRHAPATCITRMRNRSWRFHATEKTTNSCRESPQKRRRKVPNLFVTKHVMLQLANFFVQLTSVFVYIPHLYFCHFTCMFLTLLYKCENCAFIRSAECSDIRPKDLGVSHQRGGKEIWQEIQCSPHQQTTVSCISSRLYYGKASMYILNTTLFVASVMWEWE